ncbi:ABC transporter permease, partial [Bacteroidota bacterium]
FSSMSRELTSKFEGSPFFNLREVTTSLDEAEELLNKNETDIIIHFENGFEKNLIVENKADIQVIVNAIDAAAAGLTQAYAMAVIQDFNMGVTMKWKQPGKAEIPAQIKMESSFWYNPEMNYKFYMLPGILVILVTIIGLFLTSMNLVREKEIGTMEQINVTPIKKYQFIAGKLIPFLIIGLLELAIGLTIGHFFFNLPIRAFVGLIFLFATAYLLVVLGMGLFISTITRTQQQSMFIAWFFMMIFLLMSGLFTPTESMPDWGQALNVINPVSYFIRAIRMLVLKGSTFTDIFNDLMFLFIYGILVLSLAVWRYRKVV